MVKIKPDTVNGRCQRILAGLGEGWFVEVLD